jgi:hypothetical protein
MSGEHETKRANEFVAYYVEEMVRNIDQLLAISERLDEEAIDVEQVLQDLQQVGQSMCDLAMVYGYDGVEVVGRRVLTLAGDYRKDRNLEKLRFQVLEAAKAAREVMEEVDEARERQILRRWDASAATGEVWQESEQEGASEPEDLLFDIREDERLLSLLSDADGQAYEISDSERYHAADQDRLKQISGHSLTGGGDTEQDEIPFDIPEEDRSFDREETPQDDVLEIDFRESDRPIHREHFLKKIGRFLGLGKSRITIGE